MEGLKQKILERMLDKSTDVYFTTDFSDLGELEIIKVALAELDNSQKIKELTKDIYAVYVKGKFGGKYLEYTLSLAKSYAIKTGITLTEIGAQAANFLGFSTQNVMGELFLITGEPMEWDLGGRKVRFKKGSYGEMFLGRTLEGSLIRAWYYLGETFSFDLLPYLYKQFADKMNWDVIIKADNVLPEWMICLAKKSKKIKEK